MNNSGRILYRGLLLVCAVCLLLDLLRHDSSALDAWFGFYPVVGLATGVLLVWVARRLRILLTRTEDYYK